MKETRESTYNLEDVATPVGQARLSAAGGGNTVSKAKQDISANSKKAKNAARSTKAVSGRHGTQFFNLTKREQTQKLAEKITAATEAVGFWIMEAYVGLGG